MGAIIVLVEYARRNALNSANYFKDIVKPNKLKDFPAPHYKLEVARMDWECAPCGVTRDSDALTRANFDALCDLFDNIDPYGEDWEVARFSHWAVGWVEEIFVRPKTRVAELAAETRTRLATYPCISEDLWIEYDAEDNAGKVSSVKP